MSTGEKKGQAGQLSFDVNDKISRRDFLGLSAAWACAAAWVLTMIGLLKFPKPALLPDISNKFKIGLPEDFPLGTVRVFQDKHIIVSRDEGGIFAISLVCTHLGCIVTKTDQGFACPCHGSRYDQTGNVTRGPAPRALDWFEVSQLPDGKMAVDAGARVPEGTKFSV